MTVLFTRRELIREHGKVIPLNVGGGQQRFSVTLQDGQWTWRALAPQGAEIERFQADNSWFTLPAEDAPNACIVGKQGKGRFRLDGIGWLQCQFQCVDDGIECFISLSAVHANLFGCDFRSDGEIHVTQADATRFTFMRLPTGWELRPNKEVAATLPWVDNVGISSGGLTLDLILETVRFDGSRTSQYFIPKTPDGTLPVEPSLLKKEKEPDPITNPPYCGLRLANGALVASRSGLNDTHSLEWLPHEGSISTLGIFTNLRDGRGLPLAAEFVNTPISLAFRSSTAELRGFVRGLGLIAPAGTGTVGEMPVDFKSDVSVRLRDSPYPCKIVSLAWEERAGGNDWSVELRQGHKYIKVAERAPRRIRGFARNSSIDVVGAVPGREIDATLRVSELCIVKPKLVVTLGTAQSLVLNAPAGAKWNLNVLFEEEDFAGSLFAQGSANSGVTRLERLDGNARSTSICLPVTDLGISVSDTSFDVDRWLTHWNHVLDRDLMDNFPALGVGDRKEPLHAAAGFRRLPPKPLPIATVLGGLRAPAVSGAAVSPIRTPIETRRSRPELRAISPVDSNVAAWLDRKLARQGYVAQLARYAMAPATQGGQQPATFEFGELIKDSKQAVDLADAADAVKRGIQERIDWLEVVLFGRPENLGTQYADDSEWRAAFTKAQAVKDQLIELRRAVLSTTCTCEGSLPLAPDFARLLKLLVWIAKDGALATSLQHGSLWKELAEPVVEGRTILFSSAENFDFWWSHAQSTKLADLRILAQRALGLGPNAKAQPTLALQELLACLQRAAWWWQSNSDWPREYKDLDRYLKKMEEAGAMEVAALANLLRDPTFTPPWPPTYFSVDASVGKLPDNVKFEMPGLSGVLMSRTPSLETVLRVANLAKQFDKDTKPEIYACLEYLRGIEDIVNKSRNTLLRIVSRPGMEQLTEELRNRWEGEAQQLLKEAGDKAGAAARAEIETLIQRCPRLDEKTMEQIRGLSDAARVGLASALEISKKAPEAGATLLRELGNAPTDYVAVGRRVHVAISDGVANGYTEVRKQIDAMTALIGQPITLCSLGSNNSWDFVACEGSVFILKLSKRRSLEQILTELHERFTSADNKDPLGLAREITDPRFDSIAKKAAHWVALYVDPAVASSDWQGLFVLRPMVDLGGDQVTRDLAGVRQIEMKYAALCGPVLKATPKSGARDSFDIWARISMHADASARDDDKYPKTADRDAVITLLRFDAHIRNTRLLPKSRIDLRLDIGRMFGKVTGQGDREKARLDIYGRIVEPEKPGDAARFEFSTEMTEPRRIGIGVMFFKEIWIQRVAAAFRNGRTALELDAKLALQNCDGFGDNAFPFESKGGQILLRDFRLLMPSLGDSQIGVPRGLRFDFGALSGMLSSPRALTLGLFQFEVWELGYVRKHLEEGHGTSAQVKADAHRLEHRFRTIRGPKNISNVSDMPYVVFRVTFGGLPGLDRASGSKVCVFLLVGKDKNDLIVAAGDLEARDIRLTVFEALQLYIGQLYFKHQVDGAKPADGTAARQYSAFYVNDFRLSVLGWSLIGDQDADVCKGTQATLLHMQDDAGDSGFVTFCKPRKFPLIDVDWILLGRNIQLKERSYQEFLLADRSEYASAECVNKAFVEMEYSLDKEPILKRIEADLAGNGAWLFGVSFQIGGSLLENCALVLQDGVYYGIRLRGTLIRTLFEGAETLAVAYQPGKSAAQDRFYISTKIPLLDLFGGAGFNSGWVTLGWSFNSDTLLGLGFPFREGAMYRWDQSFSCYQGIYQAQFGFYIEKRSSLLQQDSGDLQLVELRGGLALEFGYGVNLGGGWLYIRAGIGVFVIVEGSLTLAVPASGKSLLNLNGGVYGFTFNGVIGVLAYVEGYINVWIISARFRADLQASLAVSVTYKKDNPILVTYDATLYAGYYARACIDCGISEICMTVQGSYPVRVNGQAKI